jgi:hypothetical protein
MELPAALDHQIPKRLFLDLGVLYEVDSVTLLGFGCSRDAHINCVGTSLSPVPFLFNHLQPIVRYCLLILAAQQRLTE